MTKLELQSKYLLSQLGNDKTEGENEHSIEQVMKSFACDVLNLVEGLREKQVDKTVIKSMVEEYGINYNLKSKKFL